MNNIIKRGKNLFLSPQTSILSAATLIMAAVIAAKLIGFVKQRVLFTFFSPEETDLLFAAFELPDTLFEILVFGVVSAAFIPVFSSYISRKKEESGWHMATSSLSIVLFTYLFFGTLVFIFARPLYSLLAGGAVKGNLGIEGGFSPNEVKMVVSMSRVLLVSQIFFVVSSFMTGILESYKRFLAPSIAPLLYNLSIIAGTILLAPKFGLYAPVAGAFMGAFLHLSIQIPLAFHLGFRPRISFDYKDRGVKKLLRLSVPRIFELSIFQIKRFVWLFLGSLVSGGFTYLKSADLLATLPIGVFGMSMAKAALPTLSRQAGAKDMKAFNKTLFTTLNQIVFLVLPLSVYMVVLRVPIVRLVFGATQFDWPATVETGRVLSAFAVGMFAYASSLLVTRAYYALEDTKTPVTISVISVILNALIAFYLVLVVDSGTWGIAFSYALAGVVQITLLITILIRRLGVGYSNILVPFFKILVASVVSGALMYVLVKLLDESVWNQGLSFLGQIDLPEGTNVARYTVDTRYTFNLLFLTGFVSLWGFALYVVLLKIMKSHEVESFIGFAKRILIKRKISPIPAKEKETVTPPPTDTGA